MADVEESITMNEKIDADTGTSEPVEPAAMDEERVDREVDPEPLDRLLEQAGERELLGEGGLLSQLTKQVLESALDAELTDHLGYDRGDPVGRGSGNSRNGTTPNAVRRGTFSVQAYDGTARLGSDR